MMGNNLSMTGTFSKHPQAWGFEPDLAVTVGNGARVGLTDGHHYIDWVSGLGTNLFGYGYFKFQLIDEMVGGGGSFSLPHKLECKAANLLADMLSRNIPYWRNQSLGVRFALSGTEAVSMAVRLARSVTDRPGILVLEDGYHGWADWTIARTKPADGIPPGLVDYIEEFKFNDIKSLHQAGLVIGNKTNKLPAAIVIEQGLESSAGFYSEVRKYCDDHGVLLIMDEVVTGLRYGLGGVCESMNVSPDLICMGKALGNGLPVSALVGGSNLMNEFSKTSPVFCSSTHWGNSLNMAAAVAVLSNWNQETVAHIWEIGKQLIAGLGSAGWRVVGDPPRSLVTFVSIEEQAFFIHGMREEGFLMNRPNFPTLSHTVAMVDQTVQASRRVRAKYGAAQERATLTKHVAQRLPRVLFRDR